jgi:rSAM/selenodomain-associated transferase 2/rSAM/selenodomain-associated transferase 1
MFDSPASAPGIGAPMRISIVVPALDEEATIAASLRTLQTLRAAGHEVIVVDGGSADRTLELAIPLADRAFVAARGRAAQMNAGAAHARGNVLLFLHADTCLPERSAAAIAHALQGGSQWGRFDVTIQGRSTLLPLVSTLMNLRSRASGIATGDQALFVTRTAFHRVNGFPAVPLMEDIAMSKALKRVAGRPACLRERVVTSGRRWDTRGPLRTILAMWRLRFDYWRGVDPFRLAQRYRRGAHALPVLHVFAKQPLPGSVKTRLAAQVGAEAAAHIYRELAEATLATAASARDAGVVSAIELWCDPDPSAALFACWRDRYRVTLRTQHHGDLGERMRYSLASSLARASPALLIGTDAPAIDVDYLARATSALADHDAVLGPAEDGGYVLIGLTRDVDLFSDIEWSTASVLAATRARLTDAGLTFAELPALWDVDTPADLKRYREWQGQHATVRDQPAAPPAHAGGL